MADMQVIAEGVGADSAEIARADALLKEGDQAELRIFVESPPTPEDLDNLEIQLINQGVLLWDKVTYDSGIIVIRYVKTAAPSGESIGVIWFIPVIIAGVVTIVGGILGWQLASRIGAVLKNPIFIIGAIGVLLYFLTKPKQEPEKEASYE